MHLLTLHYFIKYDLGLSIEECAASQVPQTINP